MIKKIVSLVMCVTMLFSISFVSMGNYIDDMKPTSQYGVKTNVQDMDQVIFGNYRDEVGTDIKFPIWWVLAEYNKEENYAILLSKWALVGKPYDNKGNFGTTWETSSLREWLNNDFLNEAFDEEEKKIILPFERAYKTNHNHYNDVYSTCTDYVTMLTFDECKKYFYHDDMGNAHQDRLATSATEYAQTQDDDKRMVDKWWNTYRCYYWLIDSTRDGRVAGEVDPLGNATILGYDTTGKQGVRPMIKVKADALVGKRFIINGESKK